MPRLLLLTLFAALSAGSSGCVRGSPGKFEYAKTNIVDRAFITKDTDDAVSRLYGEYAVCEAYAEAAKNGRSDAENWSIGLSVAQVVLGGASAFTGLLSGANASSASSAARGAQTVDPNQAQQSALSAEDAALDARTYAYIAAATGGATAIILGLDKFIGPAKKREEYVSVRDAMDQHMKDASAELDLFAAEMRKHDRDIQGANRHLTRAYEILRACPKSSQNLSWNDEKIRAYHRQYSVEVNVFIADVKYANNVDEEIREREALLLGLRGKPDPTDDEKSKIETLTSEIALLKSASRYFEEGQFTELNKLIDEHAELRLPRPPSRPAAQAAGGRKGS